MKAGQGRRSLKEEMKSVGKGRRSKSSLALNIAKDWLR